jgi:hypothetical protein
MRMVIVLAVVLAVCPVPGEGAVIPAFARRYGVSCQMCHNPIPALTAFGETFGGNGFRMRPDEPPTDTVNTGDEELWLPKQLPLAMRLDAYLQAYTGGRAVTDFETPYNIKILSGGPISRKLSYYLYFFLFERGEIGGIEDALVQVNDIGGKPVDLVIGQFQVSDPMFKREIRLEFQDYAVYRARIGDQPADLTYDRGLVLTADVAGFTLSAQAVNGNGRGEALANRRFDDDAPKNFMLHVTRDLVNGVRLGTLGYTGRQKGDTVTNALWMLGADATISFGPVELNAQYLHREDDAPTFARGEAAVETDGGFAELIVRPAGSRWSALALYNRISASRPLLNPRLGGPSGLRRYETLSGGAGYLVRRNFRVYGEATWDLEARNTQWTVGLTTAF